MEETFGGDSSSEDDSDDDDDEDDDDEVREDIDWMKDVENGLFEPLFLFSVTIWDVYGFLAALKPPFGSAQKRIHVPMHWR